MRPLDLENAIHRKYPGVWQTISDLVIQGRDQWPHWCYAPVYIASVAMENYGVSMETFRDIGAVAILSAWRLTKSVYRFDPDIRDALTATPISKIPTEILFRLPEWCIYIDFQGWSAFEVAHGAFVSLEYDFDRPDDPELRITFDQDEGLMQLIPIHLVDNDLERAIRRGIEIGLQNSEKAGGILGGQVAKDISKIFDADLLNHIEEIAANASKILSLILYLCSEEPDLSGDSPPTRPKPRKTKRGLRFFHANNPSVVEVGFNLGKTIRSSVEGPGTGTSKRPHIRRAHWHTYRTGKGRAIPKLKWIAPVAVNAGGDIPVTVKNVR